MSYPFQCVLPVDDEFPDSALPLVEPLACLLRGLHRLQAWSGAPESNSALGGGGCEFTVYAG